MRLESFEYLVALSRHASMSAASSERGDRAVGAGAGCEAGAHGQSGHAAE